MNHQNYKNPDQFLKTDYETHGLCGGYLWLLSLNFSLWCQIFGIFLYISDLKWNTGQKQHWVSVLDSLLWIWAEFRRLRLSLRKIRRIINDNPPEIISFKPSVLPQETKLHVQIHPFLHLFAKWYSETFSLHLMCFQTFLCKNNKMTVTLTELNSSYKTVFKNLKGKFEWILYHSVLTQYWIAPKHTWTETIIL